MPCTEWIPELSNCCCLSAAAHAASRDLWNCQERCALPQGSHQSRTRPCCKGSDWHSLYPWQRTRWDWRFQSLLLPVTSDCPCSCPRLFHEGGDASSWGCSLPAAGTALGMPGQGGWDPGWDGVGGPSRCHKGRHPCPEHGTPACCRGPVSLSAAGHCHCSCSPCQTLTAPAGTNQGANFGLVCRRLLTTPLLAQSKGKIQGCSGPVLKCTQRGWDAQKDDEILGVWSHTWGEGVWGYQQMVTIRQGCEITWDSCGLLTFSRDYVCILVSINEVIFILEASLERGDVNIYTFFREHYHFYNGIQEPLFVQIAHRTQTIRVSLKCQWHFLDKCCCVRNLWDY